jgi:hypothetical protein
VNFEIRILINVQCRKFIDRLKNFFDFKIVSEYLPMLDIVQYRWPLSYLNIIIDLRWQRILNRLAETNKESTKVFSSLGIKEMLKDEKKLSIRSHTLFF